MTVNLSLLKRLKEQEREQKIKKAQEDTPLGLLERIVQNIEKERKSTEGGQPETETTA